MKTSKSLKISKKEYTEQLLPAIAGYRETLQKKCGFSSDNYVRIYTGKRARGARNWLEKSLVSNRDQKINIQKSAHFSVFNTYPCK